MANILLFAPLGAALAYAGLRVGQAALVGISLSVGIEIAQLLLMPGRTTAVDDVILNGWSDDTATSPLGEADAPVAVTFPARLG